MNGKNASDKTKVKRVPKRGKYDLDTITQILDQAFVCHVGFVHDGYPVVIPTLYGRKEKMIYLHGSSASRMLKNLALGIDISIAVTLVNGIVLARSAFHHSMNYASVVLFGKAQLIENEDDKMIALRVVSDQILPGRWEEVRQPSPIEMKATSVLALEIDQASAKIRTGPPSDDKPDYELDIWAGVLPIHTRYGQAIPDDKLKPGVELPPSVVQLKNHK